MNEKPTIVIVHGAFADASSWRRKIKARKTLELDSSHVVMLSRPQQVAAFIASAASSL